MFPTEATPVSAQQITPSINLDYLQALTGTDEALQAKIMQVMLTETPRDLEKLKTAFESGDWDGVRAAAHKMKSGLQYLGLNETVALANDIELSAKEKTQLHLLEGKINTVLLSCESGLLQLQTAFEKIQQK